MSRSIREDAYRSYYLHAWDVLLVLFTVKLWPWDEWWEAIKELASFFFLIFCVLTFPIVVPIAAFMRKREAMRILKRARGVAKYE